MKKIKIISRKQIFIFLCCYLFGLSSYIVLMSCDSRITIPPEIKNRYDDSLEFFNVPYNQISINCYYYCNTIYQYENSLRAMGLTNSVACADVLKDIRERWAKDCETNQIQLVGYFVKNFQENKAEMKSGFITKDLTGVWDFEGLEGFLK